MKNPILIIAGVLFFVVAQTQSIIIDESKWHRDGPNCARVQSLAMAPSNPDVLYLGTYSKGIYKTTNGGETWTYCSTDNLGVYSDTLDNSTDSPCWWYGEYHPVDAIAIDPVDEYHIWAGTLEKGLYESTDGGISWLQANETLPDLLSVDYIDINPLDPDDILIGTGYRFTPGFQQDGGLYRTMDGGLNWCLVTSAPNSNSYVITDIKRDPVDNNHIYIGVSSTGEPGFDWGLMESFDNGNTWSEVYPYAIGCFDISINPENPQNIWMINHTQFFDYWLMFSDDGGLSWNHCEGLPFPQSWVNSMYADADFNLYAESQIIGNDDIRKAVLKSSDQGESWTEVDKLHTREFNDDINLSKKCQADPANTDNIYFGNHYGVFHSTDGGVTTLYQNSGLMNSYIFDIEVNPKNHDVIYAAGSLGLWKSQDGGKNWQIILQEEINVIKCNPQYPDTIYIGGFDLWRSYDGGTNLEKIDPSNTYYHKVSTIAINPKETNVLYCSQGGGYRSLDYGNSWEPINFGNTDKSMYTDFIIDPNHPDTLYRSIYRSIDKGDTWEEAFEKRIIGVHPQNSGILYATNWSSQANDTTIEVSYDWGNNFQVLAHYSNGPFNTNNVYCFRISQDNPDYLFYSTRNNKVFYSSNGGNDWQQLQGGYDTRVTDIIPMVNENKYFLATHGDGVWIYDTAYITSIKRKEAVQQNGQLKVSPNPFSTQTNITYDIKSTCLVNIAVYDLQGQLINTLVNENKTNGKYETLWNGKDKTGKEVKKGLYLIRLESGGDVRFCKVVVGG